MSMKKILMAAAAVTALTAGVANAAKLDISAGTTGSKVGTKFLADGIANSTTAEAYTLPSELIPTATTNLASSLTFIPSSTSAIGAGDYLVTWKISGGKFDTTSITYTGTTAGGSGTNAGSASTSSATSIVAAYTVSASQTAASFTLGVPILIGTSKTPVVISGSITNSSGTAIDGGDIAAQTVIDYRPGLKFNATAAPATLTVASGFKDFATVADHAELATGVAFVPNNNPNSTASVTYSNDLVYGTTAGTVLAATDIVQTAKLTIGGSLTAFKPRVSSGIGGGITATVLNADTGSTDTVTATGTVLTNLTTATTANQTVTVGLAQLATPVAGTESTYTVTPVVTSAAPATYTAPTFAAKAIGSVSFAGTSYYAPWVGDGASGFKYTIRITNPSTSSAIGSVRVSLTNPLVSGTSGTVASGTNCNVGNVPAAGELVITSAKLQSCFGNFTRADLTITVNGSMGSAVGNGGTIKMRAVSPDGTTFDVPLGKGTNVATQQ